jgi:hypothetical protein
MHAKSQIDNNSEWQKAIEWINISVEKTAIT